MGLAEAADVELLRLGREAGKKNRSQGQKRGKKGKNGGRGKKKSLKKKGKKNRKKGKASKKNRRNKKKLRNNDQKLFCCCNKATGEKICKKDTKICLAGFIVCDKPPTPSPPPISPPPETTTCAPCPGPGCAADLAQKMKDLKKVSNWIKQYKRMSTFLKRVGNKKGKSDNFVNASTALGTATMNGTMCGTGGPDAAANAAWNTLTGCKAKVEADCMCSVTVPNNTCEADVQKIFDDITVCSNKQTAAEICSCFQAIPAPSASCNPGTLLKGATTCNSDCQSAWSDCSSALKSAGPLVNKCKCDCVKTSSASPPVSTAAGAG